MSQETLIQQLQASLGVSHGSRAAMSQAFQELQFVAATLADYEASIYESELPASMSSDQLRTERDHLLATSLSLQAQVEQAQISLPPVAGNEVLVCGRLFDRSGRGFHGVLVDFVDAQDNVQAAFGEAESDATGFFAILVPATAVAAFGEASVTLRLRVEAELVLCRLLIATTSLEAGTQLVREFLFSRDEFREAAGQEASAGASATWSLQGIVIDRFGQPASGAVIQLQRDGAGAHFVEATADLYGRYEIAYLADGSPDAPATNDAVSLKVFEDGIERYNSGPILTYLPGQSVAQDVEMGPEPWVLQGIVKDSTQAVQAGVDVALRLAADNTTLAQVTTGAGGDYSLTYHPPQFMFLAGTEVYLALSTGANPSLHQTTPVETPSYTPGDTNVFDVEVPAI